MKYIALLTQPAGGPRPLGRKMSTGGGGRLPAPTEVPKWEALFNELGPSGVLGFGAELDGPFPPAKTVRVRDGETLVTTAPSPRRRSSRR